MLGEHRAIIKLLISSKSRLFIEARCCTVSYCSRRTWVLEFNNKTTSSFSHEISCFRSIFEIGKNSSL